MLLHESVKVGGRTDVLSLCQVLVVVVMMRGRLRGREGEGEGEGGTRDRMMTTKAEVTCVSTSVSVVHEIFTLNLSLFAYVNYI